MKTTGMKIIALIFTITLLTPIYANAKDKATITCVGTDSGITIETQEHIDKLHPNKNHLIVKVNSEAIEFDGKAISRHKDYPVSAIAENSNMKIVYYIPTDEINKSMEPFKGRILFMIKKDGEVSKPDSRGFDALCSFGN